MSSIYTPTSERVLLPLYQIFFFFLYFKESTTSTVKYTGNTSTQDRSTLPKLSWKAFTADT